MKDVAKHAGVSVATVSNVLNNIDKKTTVNTRKKVIEAVNELNYRMDMTARSLSMGKTNLLGVFFPEEMKVTSDPVLKQNPFYSEILSGMEFEARKRGYDLLMTCVRRPEHVVELSYKRNLDGIAVIGGYSDEFWDTIQSLSMPKLSIDSYKDLDIEVSTVRADDEHGGYLAGKHLIELGHQKIAFITTELVESDLNVARYVGFSKAIVEAGLNLDDCPVIPCSISFDGGVQVGKRIRKDYPEITGVFTIGDIVAFGMIKGLYEKGYSVPKDLSIVGFDDLQMCKYITPALTTISQNIYLKGREVIRLLINRIEGIEVETATSLPVQLILRETTRRCTDE